MVSFTMGDDLHLVSRLSEHLIGFRSSFCGARFLSAGPLGDEVAGDGFQHAVDEFGLLARAFGASVDGLGPVAQGVHCALAADALQRDVVEMGGLLQEHAHEVVGDQVDLEFPLDHLRALAAQDVDFP